MHYVLVWLRSKLICTVVKGCQSCLVLGSEVRLGDVRLDVSLVECGKMGKRREKTKWSRLDLIEDRKGRRQERSSPVVGPRFEKQSRKVEQEIISEFCCVEELPDGFTKIRSEDVSYFLFVKHFSLQVQESRYHFQA